jgi:ABC-type antimicrobial peptide transport system permease subunit
VLTKIAGSGARLMVAGMATGVLAALALRRAMGASITDVPLSDPAAALAVVLFALVGLAACLVPGVRATRVNPISSLRGDS